MIMIKKSQAFVLAELSMYLHTSSRTYLCVDQGVLHVLYWNKADYLHKLLPQLAAVLQVPA